MSMSIVIADPSTVALDPAPITPGWIVEGKPEARAKELARSDDGTSVVVAWSCTAGRFHWHYSVDETVHVISGEVWITNEDDVERRLGPGDILIAEDRTGQGHVTREVGPAPRVSIFVPLG